jgi:molybdopterin converting factor subunit 1
LGSFLAQFQELAPTLEGVTITVLFFAAIREIVGRDQMTLEVPEGVTTVRGLGTHLERTVAGLSGRLGVLRWAKNEEFVDLDAPLEDGDVVALIPPVAGGSR